MSYPHGRRGRSCRRHRGSRTENSRTGDIGKQHGDGPSGQHNGEPSGKNTGTGNTATGSTREPARRRKRGTTGDSRREPGNRSRHRGNGETAPVTCTSTTRAGQGAAQQQHPRAHHGDGPEEVGGARSRGTWRRGRGTRSTATAEGKPAATTAGGRGGEEGRRRCGEPRWSRSRAGTAGRRATDWRTRATGRRREQRAAEGDRARGGVGTAEELRAGEEADGGQEEARGEALRWRTGTTTSGSRSAGARRSEVHGVERIRRRRGATRWGLGMVRAAGGESQGGKETQGRRRIGVACVLVRERLREEKIGRAHV